MNKPSVADVFSSRRARGSTLDERIAEALRLHAIAVEAYMTLHGTSRAEAKRALARAKQRGQKRSVAAEFDPE